MYYNLVFFFKQKTAYEMRISDWSSDVCSSDLNIGTALLTRWLANPVWPPWWASLTLMLQKEVADRVVARPDTSTYGRLAVLCQWRSSAPIAFEVNRNASVPPPTFLLAWVPLTPQSEQSSAG